MSEEVCFFKGEILKLEWKFLLENINWEDLSDLYEVTLGNKKPTDLETAFTNSMFRCLDVLFLAKVS